MHKLVIIAHNNNPNIYQWSKAKCGLCMHTHTYNAMPSNIDACHNPVNIKEDRFRKPHITRVHSYEILQSIRRTRKRRDSCVPRDGEVTGNGAVRVNGNRMPWQTHDT